MAAPGAFDALSAQAHSEKIVAAVAEVLRGTTALDSTFGGRIYLLPDIWLPPDVQTPAITVGPGSISDTNLTGFESEQQTVVRCTVIYNEWRTAISISDKTVQAALSVMRAAIYSNYVLAVAAFSSVPLVKRIVRTEPITFGLYEPGEPYQVAHTQTLQFVFEKNMVVTTGAAAS